MAPPEFGERLRHVSSRSQVLKVEEVRGAWENKPFSLRYMIQEEPIRLLEPGRKGDALAAEYY